MKIIFIGTSSFGIPILKKLISLKKNIVMVITQPDRPGGRGKKMLSSPVKKLTLESNLQLFQPENINTDSSAEEIARIHPDLIILVAYGQILSGKILKIPTLGCLNIHPSLLPKYRGPAPINWTIIKGEKETGISFLFMDEKIDTGDIIFQNRMKILPGENFDQLSSRLAEESAGLLEKVLLSIEKSDYKKITQQKGKMFYARKINKDDCRIDWNQRAVDINNLIRGLTSLPGAYTEFNGRRVKITETSLPQKTKANINTNEQKAGTINGIFENGLEVITGDGDTIIIHKLVPAGSKEMDALAFSNGYHIKIGDIFN